MRARISAHVSRLPRAVVMGALALAIVSLAATCGTGGLGRGGDASRGKQLFQQACAACHTLADAGTQGNIGPNLDDAFAADRKQGFKESTIKQIVLGQIRFPITDPSTCADGSSRPGCKRTQGMPANLVTGGDAVSVAAYVALVAGKPVAGGGGGKITATDGKTIFQQAGCTSCHTLKDAGSTGTIGPNLDQSRPSKSLAVDRVTNGRGAMPSFKDRLTPAQIDAVAAYVSSVAGK